MKSFSDANSTVEQERLRDAIIARRVEVLRQFAGAITERVSGTAIKIAGDATGEFVSGDGFLIPLDDFETLHIITASPSYASGETTLTCAASSFGTGIVGMNVAKRFIVSGGNTERMTELGNILIETEGDTLAAWQAADVEMAFDNGDGFFANSAGDGLFDGDEIMLVRVFLGWKGATDRLLIFGGQIDRDEINDNRFAKLFSCVAFGHLKELERYPVWLVAEPFGLLPRITGVELIGIVAGAGDGTERVTTLDYKFPDGADIKGLAVNSFSADTTIGFHVVKFRPPDLFQFDYGAWTQLTAATDNETLTGYVGQTININTPDEFDIVPRQDMFYISNRRELANIAALGKPTLQFDDGLALPVKHDVDFIIRYDNTAVDYTDLSVVCQMQWVLAFPALEAADDAIIILATERFFGLLAELETNFSGTLIFEYTRGFDDWNSFSPTDNTNNFSQSGAITWGAIADWRACYVEIDGTGYEDMFGLRITASAYTSGSAAIKRLSRYMRLIGQDGTLLDVRAQLEKLPGESRSDKLVIKDNGSGTLEPCVFRQNMSFEAFLKLLLDYASYPSGNRELDDLKISDSLPFCGIWGKIPLYFYNKQITAIGIDRNQSPETVWLGVEDELWCGDRINGFTFIDKIDPYIRASDEKMFRIEIRRLVIDGNGYLQGLAWKNYFDQPLNGRDYDTNYVSGRAVPAVVFRSTSLTAITEQNKVDESDISEFTSQEVCFRDGYSGGAPNTIGQFGAPDYELTGENIAIPFPQYMWNLWTVNTVLEPRSYLLTDDTPGNTYAPGQLRSPGFYAVDGSGNVGAQPLGFCYSWGQQGLVVWDEGLDKWLYVRLDQGATDNYIIAALAYTGVATDLLDLGGMTMAILAGCAYNGKLYYVLHTYNDDGGTFPGDYSDCVLKRIDNDGNNNTTLFDFASDSIENNQSLSDSDLTTCSIIDMSYNENDDTLVGCIFNRYDLSYHIFVYDISNDKLYSSQTGTDFTFQDNRQVSNFLYNDNDDKIYATVLDRRYDEDTTLLVVVEFAAPSGSPDGSEITITYQDELVRSETAVAQLALGYAGCVYGISGPRLNYLFQFHTEFYPRGFLFDTNEQNFRELITQIAESMNRVVNVRANRKIRLVERNNYDGSKTLEENKHIISMQPLRQWEHYYDRVEVKWADPFGGDNGTAFAGGDGWNRKVLEIDNPLIQTRELAQLIANMMYTFVNTKRYVQEAELCAQLELEEFDRINFIVNNNRADVDRTKYYNLQKIDIDPDNLSMVVEGIH